MQLRRNSTPADRSMSGGRRWQACAAGLLLLAAMPAWGGPLIEYRAPSTELRVPSTELRVPGRLVRGPVGRLVGGPVGGPRGGAGGGSDDNSILLVVIRGSYADRPEQFFLVFIDVLLPNVSGVTGVSAITGGGIPITLEHDWPHTWSFQAEVETLEELQDALHGSWTITINGSTSSTSTFTLNASAIDDASIFTVPGSVHPVQGGLFDANDTFEWSPPTSGPLPADLIAIFIDYEFSAGPDEFLPGDATTWQPPPPLLIGPAALGIAYVGFPSAALISPLTVTSGSVPGGWGAHELSPPGWPDATPLLAQAGEREIEFTITGCPDPGHSNWINLGIERINDPAAPPGSNYQVSIDVATGAIPGVSAVSVVTGGGTPLGLKLHKEKIFVWIEPHRLFFSSLEEAKAFVHGEWTVEIDGCEPSTSTFTADADALTESDFFVPPVIVYPQHGASGVPLNTVFTWMPPASGPFPPDAVSAWINWMGPGGGGGPEEILPKSATSWEPDEDLRTGPARWSIGYYDIAPLLVSPIIVQEGKVPGGWEVDPDILKLFPDYPDETPLYALGGVSKAVVSIQGCEGNFEVACSPSAVEWVNPLPGDFHDDRNWDGSVVPGAGDDVAFGQNSGVGLPPFVVTFSQDAASRSVCVTNQSPIFDMKGVWNSFISEHVAVGLDPPSSEVALTILDGTLWTPIMVIGRSGRLSGNGWVVGEVENIGLVRPGSPLGLSVPGSIVVDGDYYQSSCGRFEPTIAKGGGTHGMSVFGGAVLAGAMRILVSPDALPELDESFIVLTAGELFGEFSAVIAPFLGADRMIQVQEFFEEGAEGGGAGGAGIIIVIVPPGGSPDFDDPETLFLEGIPTGVTSADIEAVAASDLALSIKALDANDPGIVLVLLNNGDGSAFTPVVVEVGVEPSAIVAADLEGKGEDAIAVTNRGDDNVSVLFHDGVGGFDVVNVNVGSQPSAIASGDFLGRGVIDLAVTNEGDDTVTILLNGGDQTFTALPPIAVGSQPMAIAAGPLVGKAIDLVVANFGDGTITILFNDGDGMFIPSSPIPVGQGPGFITLDDFDHDKDIDIVVGNTDSGTISILRNLGEGNFGMPAHLPLDGSPGSLAAWDMDADGDVDIVVVVDDDELGEVIRILRNDTPKGSQTLTFTLMDPIGEGENPRLVGGVDVTGNMIEDLIAVNVVEFEAVAGGKGKGPDSSLTIRPNLLGGPPANPADLNGDNIVDVLDLLILLDAWGACPKSGDCPADFNGDDSVDVLDLLFLLDNWG